MTLSLFGRYEPWEQITSAEPVVSGSHPLHQYHGYLGAQSLLWTGTMCCYDPFFQAGYPKTPVFDAGSRPAALFSLAAGGEFNPAAYKIGLAVCCLLVPLLLIVAARGFLLCGWGTATAVLLGLAVWWGSPAQTVFHTGELDLLMASLMLLAHTGLLIRFDRAPGVLAWLGLFVTAALGWFAHPLLFALVVPLLLVYYLGAGVRHRTLLWHVSLLGCQVGAVALNTFWMIDWIIHWWIHAPLARNPELLAHRTLRSIWEAPLWGQPMDRTLAAVLLGSGLFGVALLNARKRRIPCRLLALGSGGFLLLAILGISLDFWGRIGTADLLMPALWFAVPAAAYAFMETFKAVVAFFPSIWLRVCAAIIMASLIVYPLYKYFDVVAPHFTDVQPLAIGLRAEQQQLVRLLVEKTNKDARILWEDRTPKAESSRWPVFLPLLTGRSFVGGLDPNGSIEYSQAGFVRFRLGGKSIKDYGDADLKQYCRRYNIGWVVAWSPAVVQRLQRWQDAVYLGEVCDGEKGRLFQIKRSASFTLYGKATVLEAHYRQITLGDVQPKNGKVILSFHYLSNLRASPSRVRIEPQTDAHDPVPLLRLHLDKPAVRVTITWDKP